MKQITLLAALLTVWIVPFVYSQTAKESEFDLSASEIIDDVKALADNGDAFAQDTIGTWYMYGGEFVSQDYTKAARYLRMAAEQGHAEAQVKVAILYGKGDGMEVNDEKAVYYLSKAAEQGEPGGQFLLGHHYRHGRGVPENDEKALSLYRKAAKQGIAAAQHELGLMYCIGEGIPTDYVQCYAWLNLSAAQGDESSREAKNRLISDMTAEQIAEAQKLSGKYWELYGTFKKK